MSKFQMDMRVRHRTGQVGTVIGQPDGDPIVRFDYDGSETVCYMSEVTPIRAAKPALNGWQNVDDRYRPPPLRQACWHGRRRWRQPSSEDYREGGICGSCGPISIYVASSWRNAFQSAVVHTLRAAGAEVYDFKNPPDATGFTWKEAALKTDLTKSPHADLVNQADYLKALNHPRAVAGFESDFDAMQAADIMILVLPCGRSAHLELGWAVGAGKRTAILLDDPCTPELMVRMCDYVSPSLHDLLGWLGVED